MNKEFVVPVSLQSGCQSFSVEIKSDKKQEINYISQIICLNDNKIFVYLFNGEFFLYDLQESMKVIQGILEPYILRFFVYQNFETIFIFYFSLDDKIVKLLDLLTGKIVNKFLATFPSYYVLPKNLRKVETIQECLQFSKIYLIPNDTYLSLIVMEQFIAFSAQDKVYISLFELPLKSEGDFSNSQNPKKNYLYANSQGQKEFLDTIIDGNTLALCGQFSLNNQIEILLIQPQLKEKFYTIVLIPQTSLTLVINISCWRQTGQLALWLNDNNEQGYPYIDIIQLEYQIIIYIFNSGSFIQQNKNLLKTKFLYKQKDAKQFQDSVYIVKNVNMKQAIIHCQSISDNKLHFFDMYSLENLYSIDIRGKQNIQICENSNYMISYSENMFLSSIQLQFKAFKVILISLVLNVCSQRTKFQYNNEKQ